MDTVNLLSSDVAAHRRRADAQPATEYPARRRFHDHGGLGRLEWAQSSVIMKCLGWVGERPLARAAH